MTTATDEDKRLKLHVQNIFCIMCVQLLSTPLQLSLLECKRWFLILMWEKSKILEFIMNNAPSLFYVYKIQVLQTSININRHLTQNKQ